MQSVRLTVNEVLSSLGIIEKKKNKGLRFDFGDFDENVMELGGS